MPFYAGSARVANIRVEQLPELGVSDYGFLPMNGADVVRSVALKNDTDAGTWATIKLLATGVGTFAGGPAVGGLALLGASAFEDAYTAYHENKKGGEQFWSDYLKNLEEVARPDSGLRDMAEGFNAVTSYIAKGAGNALPLSKGWGYHVGDITGMLLRDTAAFMIGGASGGLTLPANMAISEFFNAGAEKYAMTDDLSAAMRPAIAAGVSSGATGALFLYGLPKVLGTTSYKLINGVANTPFEKAATIAANSAVGGAEFAGWTGAHAITQDWINGDFSLPSVDPVSILASAGMGIVIRGAVRSHGVFKGNHPEPTPPAVEPVTAPAATVAEPMPAEQLQKIVDDVRSGVRAYTSVGDGITEPLSNMQAARMADSIGKQYRELTAAGQEVNLGDLVTTRMARFSGFSDEYRNGTIGGGGGRYYSAENIEKINGFLYKQMPNSQEIKSLESYYADMRKRVFPDEPVATVKENGVVEIGKQNVAQRYDAAEKELTEPERNLYDAYNEQLAKQGIGGYQAKRLALGKISEWRGNSIFNDMDKKIADAQVAAKKEIVYTHDTQIDATQDDILSVLKEAQTQLGLDEVLFAAKRGTDAYRLKEYERIAPDIMRKNILSRGGTPDDAVVGMEKVSVYLGEQKLDVGYAETKQALADALQNGTIDATKYGEEYVAATNKYLKAIEANREQVVSTTKNILKGTHGADDKVRGELSKILDGVAAKYGGIIPRNIGLLYKDAIASSHGDNWKFSMKDFRAYMNNPDVKKRLEIMESGLDAMKVQKDIDIFGQPVKVDTKKAKEAKSAGSK